MAKSPVLQITLFGNMHITTPNGALVLPSSASVRSLLAYLLLHHDTFIARERLAGFFWADRSETRARRTLSNALWQVRSSLEDAAERLTAQAESVTFHLHTGDWLDVAEFECLLDTPDDVPPANRLANFRAAIELYQDDLLCAFYDDWCLLERERLRERYLRALAQLLMLHKQQGAYAEALDVAHRLVAADPLHEVAQQEVMRLHYLLGRPRAALTQFEHFRALLREELGAEPMSSSVALSREIAAAMDAPDAPYLPLELPPPLLGDLARLPFVGRQEERAQLLHALKSALQGHGGLAIVRGAAGVGKTRLVHELIADAEWRGFQVGLAKVTPLGAPPPYQLLREALAALLTPLRIAQLAGLVEPRWLSALRPLFPAIHEQLPDLPALPPLDLQSEWQRLWAALARCLGALASITPLLLVLEDIHWADNASLAALPHLADGLADVPLLLVFTSRIVEAQARPLVLETLEAAAQRAPLTRIALRPFAPAEVVTLIERTLEIAQPDAAARAFVERLRLKTGGNALHLLESLKFFLEQGALALDERGGWRFPQANAPLDVPASIKGLIAERLTYVPATAREVLDLVAVLGENADFRVLAAASVIESAALPQHLEHLRQRGFLRHVETGYRLDHDQIQDIVYAAIAPARRRVLHRRAGEALEALDPQQVEPLAHHFRQSRQWNKAAEYYKRAGDRARAVYANAEAEVYYTHALEALDQGADDSSSSALALRFDVYLAREQVYALQGAQSKQQEALATLATLAERLQDPCRQAEVALQRANYAEATGDYPASIAAAQTAIELAHAAQQTDVEAAGYLKWGLGLWHQGEYDPAQRRIRQALDLAQDAALGRVEADSLHNLGNVFLYQDKYDEAGDYFEQSHRAYHELGDRRGEGNALHNLGFVCHALGDRENGLTHYRRSLDLYREIGFRRGESTALANIGVIHQDHGNYPQAQEHFEQALHIYQEIGDRQNQAMALANIGIVHENLGETDQATGYYKQALQIYRELGDRRGEGLTLANLSLNAHLRGDNIAALDYARNALDITHELGNRSHEASVLNDLGHALTGLGRLEEAIEVYQQAVTLRRELGDQNLVMEILSGLARALLAQGDVERALRYVEEILNHLQSGNLDGTDEPARIYLTCYRVLRAAQDARASAILDTAHRLLQERAAVIEDAAIRRAFFENVAYRREICELYQQQRGQQRTVRLPRVAAPTGRPLREDEYVDVTWTITRPADDELGGRVDRRRHRILRLLREAGDQGAEATVEDLAAALDVSARTIKRDLATLRAAGHPVTTRGSRDS